MCVSLFLVGFMILWRLSPKLRAEIIKGTLVRLRRRQFKLIKGGRSDEQPETLRDKRRRRVFLGSAHLAFGDHAEINRA